MQQCREFKVELLGVDKEGLECHTNEFSFYLLLQYVKWQTGNHLG